MKLKQLAHGVYGIATFIPGVKQLRIKGPGSTDSARYCYSVWMRHMVKADANNLDTNPKEIAELGPGDSLGIGLAALISGAEKYYALDVVAHAHARINLSVFDELVSLFKNRTAIPNEVEFPQLMPFLENYDFPRGIYSEERLEKALDGDRIKRIRTSIENVNGDHSMIEYRAPWYGERTLQQASVDLIYSQAVLEHVDDLTKAYGSMHLWLRQNGFVSHQIDFTCHGTADVWNGHWTYSDLIWKLIRGKRPYLLNREPYSTHLKLIAEAGFDILFETKFKSASQISRSKLAARFERIPDDDLTTSGVFLQAVKRK